MPTGLRLTFAGLGLALVTIVLGTTVMPIHVSLGAGSLRCGTVRRPDRTIEVAPLCHRAAANQLRAVLVFGALLTAMALLPAAVAWRHPGGNAHRWTGWAVAMVAVAVVALAAIGWAVEYAPKSVFVDL